MTFRHSLAKCQKKKEQRRHLLLPLPCLDSLDASPGVEGSAEGLQHGESGWGLFSKRKRERTIVRKRRETNRERVCCCSLPWLGSVDASSGGWKLLGKPRMEGGLGGGGGGEGRGWKRVENRGKTVLETEKRG